MKTQTQIFGFELRDIMEVRKRVMDANPLKPASVQEGNNEPQATSHVPTPNPSRDEKSTEAAETETTATQTVPTEPTVSQAPSDQSSENASPSAVVETGAAPEAMPTAPSENNENHAMPQTDAAPPANTDQVASSQTVDAPVDVLAEDAAKPAETNASGAATKSENTPEGSGVEPKAESAVAASQKGPKTLSHAERRKIAEEKKRLAEEARRQEWIEHFEACKPKIVEELKTKFKWEDQKFDLAFNAIRLVQKNRVNQLRKVLVLKPEKEDEPLPKFAKKLEDHVYLLEYLTLPQDQKKNPRNDKDGKRRFKGKGKGNDRDKRKFGKSADGKDARNNRFGKPSDGGAKPRASHTKQAPANSK